jgi:hypothetical protein
MFGLGIFTYIKIGLAVVIISVCGYYVWNYHHMASKIAAQQIQIDNFKLELGVLADKQKAFDEFMAKKTVVKRRVASVEQEVDQDIESGDVTRILDMFHGLRGSNQTQPPAHGGTGRVKPAPGRAPGPGLN